MNKKTIPLCLSVILLAGCWDQNPLRKNVVVVAGAFDKINKDNILTTVALRSTRQISGGENETVNSIVSASGHTLRDTRIKIDKKTVGNYSPNKIRVILIGEELARDPITPHLDAYLRDPKLTLSASVVVTKGKAGEIIKLNKYQNKLIGEALTKLLESAETISIIAHENQQTIKNKISDEGKDFVLPYLELKDKDIVFTGVALFHGDRYTGRTLKEEYPELLLLMQNKQHRNTRLMVRSGKEKELKNYISYTSRKSKRDIMITTKGGKPRVTLSFNLTIEINEYNGKSLRSQKDLDELNRIISRRIEKEMDTVIQTLQEANCDALGLGRMMIAHHPETWNKMNWENDYPLINITSRAKVKIINRGLIY
ncbi:Ger(x)C family spore germination protein [Neobacillus sp. NRS-1170]|uniref:Ger(x)C family spore germination protein n=1 Tax=Neobacillus sp. NRS-1170 TaxID=3233898 RepID=UPI003D2E4DD2